MNNSYFSNTQGTFIVSNDKIYNKNFYRPWTVVESLPEDVVDKGPTSSISNSFGLNILSYRSLHALQSFVKKNIDFDENLLGQGGGSI